MFAASILCLMTIVRPEAFMNVKASQEDQEVIQICTGPTFLCISVLFDNEVEECRMVQTKDRSKYLWT